MRRSVFVVAFAVACRRDAPAPPDPPKAPPAPAASVAKVLSLVSTTKVEQVIGDFDKHTKTKTRSQTSARFGVLGTDLGQSFEHAGKVYFLFGDTIGPGGGGDPIGYATSPDADGGLSLSFVGEGEGNYLKVKPDGKKMAGFEVPIAGIDLGGTAYLVCKIDHAGDDEDGPTDRAVIVRFDEANGKFPIVRTLSTLPDGHFVKVALVRDGEWIYIFGSGRYRRSSV